MRGRNGRVDGGGWGAWYTDLEQVKVLWEQLSDGMN